MTHDVLDPDPHLSLPLHVWECSLCSVCDPGCVGEDIISRHHGSSLGKEGLGGADLLKYKLRDSSAGVVVL